MDSYSLNTARRQNYHGGGGGGGVVTLPVPVGQDVAVVETVNETIRRPRARSLTKGIKELFHRTGSRPRSGSRDLSATPLVPKDNGPGKMSTSAASAPANHGSPHWTRKMQVMSMGRPRSRSEAATADAIQLHTPSRAAETPMPVPVGGQSPSQSAASSSTSTRSDANWTPMSQLLQSNSFGSSRVGPDEFLEMYRSRAYSVDAQKPPTGRQRRHSDVRSPTFNADSSPSLPSRSPVHAPPVVDPRSCPPSTTLTSGSPKLALSTNHHSLPQTIPEHLEMKHYAVDGRRRPVGADRLFPPPSVYARRTSIAVPYAPRSSPRKSGGVDGRPGGGGKKDDDDDDEELDEEVCIAARNARRQRRNTEPAILALNRARAMTARTAAQARIDNELRIVDALSNFPKVTPGSTLSSVTLQGSGLVSDSHSTKHVIVWKDAVNGTRVFSLPSPGDDADLLRSYGNDESTFVVQFMKRHKCYDLMPNSSKLILFDINLEVICALYALLYNGIKAAPVWDSTQQDFIGMLTVSDFIRVLQRYYISKKDFDEIEDHKISDWQRILIEDGSRPIVTIDPEQDVFEAVCSLRQQLIHRLLVVDSLTGNALYILTNKRILRFLHQSANSLPRPSFMSKGIRELDVGTYDDVVTVRLKSPLITTLKLLMERRFSCVPVIDDLDRLVDIYTKFDVINLARDQIYNNLDCTVEDALGVQRESFEGVCTCRPTDTLGTVIDWFINLDVHRMIVVDNDRRVLGVISVSDIINFLVPKHSNTNSTSDSDEDNLSVDSSKVETF